MKEAIRQAKKARALDEVPIGCVIVYEGKIIARGYNRRNTDKNTLSHAELNAIRKASKKLGDWRLEGCTMYVTLEPCQMCSGALVQSRIDEVVIGCMNPKAGCAGSVMNLLQIRVGAFQAPRQTDIFSDLCRPWCHDLVHNPYLLLYYFCYFFNPVFLAARFNGVITTRTITAATPICTRFPGMEDTGARGFP